MMISVIRVFFSDPGFFEKEYIDLYSIIKFIKYLFTYFIKWGDPDFKLSELIIKDKLNRVEDLEEIIIRIEPILTERINEVSNSFAGISKYNSIDVTKKNIHSELEDVNDGKEKECIPQTLHEDIIESFELELENFVKINEFYSVIDKLQFLEKGKDNNRFCGFCLIKKVITF
jgi:hypothetical protein